jgi:hypothetical protein
MMRPAETVEVRLCWEPVDMRKSIEGLSMLVEQELELDPFAAQLFVFSNRRRDKLKILYWDRSGFALWCKWLEKARFPWPQTRDTVVVVLTGRELGWLLDGIDFAASCRVALARHPGTTPTSPLLRSPSMPWPPIKRRTGMAPHVLEVAGRRLLYCVKKPECGQCGGREGSCD